MFLYERSLVICKKQENTGDYSFKAEVKLDGLLIEDEKLKQNRFDQKHVKKHSANFCKILQNWLISSLEFKIRVFLTIWPKLWDICLQSKSSTEAKKYIANTN